MHKEILLIIIAIISTKYIKTGNIRKYLFGLWKNSLKLKVSVYVRSKTFDLFKVFFTDHNSYDLTACHKENSFVFLLRQIKEKSFKMYIRIVKFSFVVSVYQKDTI